MQRAAELIGPIIELSPWLVQRIVDKRPFDSAADLADCIATAITNLNSDERLTLLRAHPVLAPSEPRSMTIESQSEQDRLGLAYPSPEQASRLNELNATYSNQFGFPFIIALHAQESLDSVLQSFIRRLDASCESEMATALEQIASVARSRVCQRFGVSTEETS